MSVGDLGPYVDPNGPTVWVPRTVPYLEARRVAREASQYDDRLDYKGQEDAFLLGFTRDCPCEDYCSRANGDWLEESETDDACRVPAWKFELVER